MSAYFCEISHSMSNMTDVCCLAKIYSVLTNTAVGDG